MLKWIFCPGHAGVIDNEWADFLAGQAPIIDKMTLDPPTVLANVITNSYILDALKKKGIKQGSQ